MTNASKIHLFKIRDFGLVFSDSFDFLKQNWKPIFRAIAIIAGPFYLLMGLSLGFTLQTLLGFTANPEFVDNPEYIFDWIGPILLGYLIMIVLGFIGYILIASIVFTYMKMYRDGLDWESVTTREIWNQTRQNIGKISIAAILTTLIIIAGSILCIIPGIYLFVPLSMIFIVRVEQPELSMGDAFRKCFDLSQNCWWVTLALLAVIYILISVINYGLSFPMLILIETGAFLNLNDGGALFSLSYAFNMVISMFLTSIVFITTAIIYYSHRERLEGKGLQERISNIGTETDFLPDSEGDY